MYTTPYKHLIRTLVAGRTRNVDAFSLPPLIILLCHRLVLATTSAFTRAHQLQQQTRARHVAIRLRLCARPFQAITLRTALGGYVRGGATDLYLYLYPHARPTPSPSVLSAFYLQR